MFVLEKTKYLEKGKKHFASFSSKEISKKAQFIEHSLNRAHEGTHRKGLTPDILNGRQEPEHKCSTKTEPY